MTSRAAGAHAQRVDSASQGFPSANLYRPDRLSRRRFLRVESLEDRSLLSAAPWQNNCAGSEALGVPTDAVASAAVAAEPPVIEILPGDANSDGVVDFVDYETFLSNFLQAGVWADGDFNLDFVVDGADYVIWADNFTLPSPPAFAAATAVPQAADIAIETPTDEAIIDTALLGLLSETTKPELGDTLSSTDPMLVACTGQGLLAHKVEDIAPPGDRDPADENESEAFTESIRRQTVDSLQAAVVAQAWELTAYDVSACAKMRTAR